MARSATDIQRENPVPERTKSAGAGIVRLEIYFKRNTRVWRTPDQHPSSFSTVCNWNDTW
ncbi:MAG: hypothetical protein Kow0074_23920 [Candidatus Zixiibacteriota bacterium]